MTRRAHLGHFDQDGARLARLLDKGYHVTGRNAQIASFSYVSAFGIAGGIETGMSEVVKIMNEAEMALATRMAKGKS